MANFYYKIDDESTINMGSIGYISDPRDIAQPFGSAQIKTSSDIYTPYTLGAYTRTGTFPSESGSSVSDPITSVYASGAYSLASSQSSTYSAGLKNSFDSASLASTVFNLDNVSKITFCKKDGSNIFSVTPLNYSNSIVLDWHFSSNTGYTGEWIVNCSPFGSYNNYNGKFFFLINDNVLLSVFYRTSTEQPDMSSIAVQALLYATDYSKSPFYYALKNDLAMASGSPSSESAGSSSSGLGDFEFPSEDIESNDDIPSASSVLFTGLVNPYLVTTGELALLGNFLWSSDFFDNIAKTFSNPMDCIISLSSFPVASSSMSLGSSESVRVGNTTSSSTGTRLISEFVTIDCGSVSVPEVWGSYLDYTQTKLYIYIPYLGIEELPLCECMGGSVACKLRINLLTGALVACLTLTSGTYVTGSARVQPIYFSTTCKSDIPVSGATTGALAGAFQLLGGATTAIAGVATGVAPLAVSGLASAAQGVATMQSQNSQISGAVGAAGGQMAHKTPFLIFDRPVQSVPANLASVAGYQSNSGTTLSRCSGYVICDTINLDGLALTRSELEEVEQICTSGVYIS